MWAVRGRRRPPAVEQSSSSDRVVGSGGLGMSVANDKRNKNIMGSSDFLQMKDEDQKSRRQHDPDILSEYTLSLRCA